MNLLLLLPPFVGALVGLLTNIIAVEMLFHPKKPINILGFKFQGLVPARSREIIDRFLESMSDILNEKDFEFVIDRAITRAYDEGLKNKFSVMREADSTYLSFLSRYLERYEFSQKISQKIDEWINSIVLNYLKDMVTKNIAKNVDVREFILKKAEEISEEEIEHLFKKFAKKELRFIEISGAFLGFLIGSIQSLLIYFLL
jgi:uncharacterized membrane protein YheB (UPF0754 family)